MFTSVLTFVIGWSLIATVASQCTSGWVHFQGSCYGFGDENVTWSEAEEICQVFGSHLAEVETDEENEFLKSIARNRKYAGVWLGGTDMFLEGIWLWANSREPLDFTDWHDNEPGSGHVENCLMMYAPHNYEWADGRCSTARKFACETSLPAEIVR